jgi:hypothetical protein
MRRGRASPANLQKIEGGEDVQAHCLGCRSARGRARTGPDAGLACHARHVIVPEGVPDIFNQFDGALVLLSMKVPHAPAQ